MKKLLGALLVAAVAVSGFTVSGSAMAGQMTNKFDDMSWWGNTGATPEPYPDPKGRSGYWWWPTEPASNANDSEAWGNRGVVYYCCWEKPQPPAQVPTPTPPVADTGVKARMPVSNTVLFDFDKSTLKPEGKATLDQIVAELKQFPQDTVMVEGHTCNIGTDVYNQGLSERRAAAVVQYLTSQGIDASRISSAGYGETRPAVENSSPANRALNRRAYFITSVVQ